MISGWVIRLLKETARSLNIDEETLLAAALRAACTMTEEETEHADGRTGGGDSR